MIGYIYGITGANGDGFPDGRRKCPFADMDTRIAKTFFLIIRHYKYLADYRALSFLMETVRFSPRQGK